MADQMYEVTALKGEPREWSNKHGGQFLSYRVDAKAADGTVVEYAELVQKPETPAPTVGQQIEGHIEQREYESGGEKKQDRKLAKAQQQGGYGGGGGGGGGKKFDPVADAARQAAIIRQNAFGHAINYVEMCGGWEFLASGPKIEDHEAAIEFVGQVAARFHSNVSSAAGEAAKRVKEKQSGSSN